MASPKQMSRRSMFQIGLGAAVGTMAGTLFTRQPSSDQTCEMTPKQTSGPFYPTQDQADKDVDLTIIKGHSERAEGDIIYVRGQVLDEECQPVAGALVEIWQANKWGRYSHQADTNPAPLDPNSQGWGQAVTDKEGYYGFKTIMPGAYPASSNWVRPPHIHFKVWRRGYHELITQMYFAGQELNEKDFILMSLPKEERVKVIIALESGPLDAEPGARLCRFDIVLRQVRRD